MGNASVGARGRYVVYLPHAVLYITSVCGMGKTILMRGLLLLFVSDWWACAKASECGMGDGDPTHFFIKCF